MHIIIFDRSAFHGKAFEQLQASRLEVLCQQNKVHVAHTPIFLDETLAMYGNEEKREELRKQWPFIMRICNCGIFRTRQEIFHDELVRNLGLHTRFFWTPAKRQEFEANVNANLYKDVLWMDWLAAENDRDENYQIKKMQKQIYVELRRELPVILKQKGHHQLLSTYQFTNHLTSEMDLYGRTIVEHQIKSNNNLALQNRWSRYMKRYPFITAFTEGFIYAGYYAAIHQNDPVDINSQADFELMTYLLHADILVSNDTSFLSDAFINLWKPRRKVLFTTDKFIDFITRL